MIVGMKKTLFSLIVWITLASLLSGCVGVGTPTPLAPTLAPTATPAPAAASTASAPIPWAPWPTLAWSTATPEQVGMDSAHLATLMDFLEQQDLNLHSLLIVRRGYLVFELNLYPTTTATPQEIQSATKSVTSALAGIALRQGDLKSLDQKVVDFFPKRTIANPDGRKSAITLADLLSMTSGLDWPESSSSYASKENPARAMWSSGDPVQYVLDRPMAAIPGTTFNYNTGNSQLLGAILEQNSGQTLNEFASQYLFNPLGIYNVTWHRMRGLEPGGSGLVLTARDMVKLGYLYLRKGQWGDRQVLPEKWVADSTSSKIVTSMGGYGYGWWTTANNGFSASGFGGQSIQVYPEKDLVVVATGAMGQAQRNTLHNLIQYFVLPAVVSDQPLPSVDTSTALKMRLQTVAAQPTAKKSPALPVLAAQIAGLSYPLSTNSLNWKQLKLEFPSSSEAYLVVDYTNGGSARIPAGLDGVPRVAEALRTAVLGKWSGEHALTLQYETIGSADGLTIQMTFEGKKINLTLTSYVQGDVSHAEGTAK
jgi:CubicO group peptidase (beta-lactamase class C family)